MSIMGTRVIRTEDPRLLTAGGVYVDDLRTPELSAAARLTFVRSPVAHARITGIDTSEALSEPGVIAVLTVRDMDDLAPPPPDSGDGAGEGPMPLGGVWSEPLLAVDTVRYWASRSRWSSPTAATRARTPPTWSAWTMTRCPPWSGRPPR
jgi:carbon-monoxide dehydrogenase large subunit